MRYFFLLAMLMKLSYCKCQQTDITKEIPAINKAVEYWASIESGACNFQLLINNIPIAQYFGDVKEDSLMSRSIDKAILTGGEQKWKLVLYPGYQDGKPIERLAPNTSICLEIEKVSRGNHTKRESPATKLFPMRLLTIPNKEGFAYTGKDFVAYEGTFHVEVNNL